MFCSPDNSFEIKWEEFIKKSWISEIKIFHERFTARVKLMRRKKTETIVEPKTARYGNKKSFIVSPTKPAEVFGKKSLKGSKWIANIVAKEKTKRIKPANEKNYFLKFIGLSAGLSENKYFIGTQKVGITNNQAVTPRSI